MKRYGNLFETICSFENLVTAAYRARRGKRYRPDVARFHYDLEGQVLALRAELEAGTYTPGPYRAFYIHDPKRRLISAAGFRDRVVHHAVCQVIEPIFERTFIHDSYANRQGKGTHRALDRCTAFARRYRYALKCDIEKYFPSIDHGILLSLLARKIKCARTLWLLESIIGHANPQEEAARYFPGDDLLTPFERRRGIPIGNLTSQHFANIYLNGFDHFVQDELRPGAYIRFCDDFLVFADDRAWLYALPERLQDYLDILRLKTHARKCQVMPTRCGIAFLGWQVYPDHRRVRRSTGVRFPRRLRALQEAYALGYIGLDAVKASVTSWIGHLSHGDTWGLRRTLLGSTPFVRSPHKAEKDLINHGPSTN